MEETLISYPADGHTATYQIDENSFWYRHRNKVILKLYNRYITDEKPFSDIGGGNGIVSKFLQDAGKDVMLVEPYEEGIKNAQERGVKKLVNKKVEELDFPLHHAGMFDVLEHIGDDRAALKQLYNLQQTGSILLITVPAAKALWSSVDVDLKHYRRYAVSDLKKKLGETGYTVLGCSYFFSLMWLPLFFYRVLPEKFGIKKPESKRRTAEHVKSSSPGGKLIHLFLGWELLFIKKGIKIPVGTSCFIVAKK